MKKLALTINVRTLAKTQLLVDRMLNAIAKTTRLLAAVHQDLKQIQLQIKDVFEFQQFAQLLKNVPRVICALEINAIYLVTTPLHVLLEKDVSTVFALKSVTLITTVCLEKFVTTVFVFLVVPLMLIVHTLKSVYNRNVNVAKDLLQHQQDAVILMNVARNYAIPQQYARIFLDHTNAFVQKTPLVILMEILDASSQVNVIRTTIVVTTCLAIRENVSILVH